jgi:hypothetical protein
VAPVKIGKLAADLTRPKLRARRGLAPTAAAAQTSRQRLAGAASAAAIRAAARGAHATSDTLALVARVVEGRAGAPLTRPAMRSTGLATAAQVAAVSATVAEVLARSARSAPSASGRTTNGAPPQPARCAR